jgi:radical SAM/Cys-rich protein
VQVNIGLVCNLACHHCHVESGPNRKEEMTWETMQLVLNAAEQCRAGTIDITGGAPEMHPHFARFVAAARKLGKHVVVRTNLTILLHEAYQHLVGFFAEQRVHLIASLPCYLESNVDKQRGRGVYHDSIEAIRRLNAVGYGIQPDLPLDLVYNPGGASLPPRQEALEADYKRELSQRFGIRFTRLITITNMPIGRFLHDLARQGKDQQYMQLLRNAFNPATLDGLMCRHQLHVAYDGTLYDCDFNFALAMIEGHPYAAGHIRDFNPPRFVAREILTGDHCFGCTAGAGSSCGGALA